MKYISLYTVWALENSLNIFDDYGYYFFGFSKNNDFKIDDIEKSHYLWLWEKYTFNNDKYLKIYKISKIKGIIYFEVVNLWDKFEINLDDKYSKENIEKAFTKHVDFFHKDNNWKINTLLPEKWYCISCDNKNITDIEEDVLYPYNKFISFPLNTDSDNKYIPNIKLVWKIRIWENVFFDPNKGGQIIEMKLCENDKSKSTLVPVLDKNGNKKTLDECEGIILYKWEPINLWNNGIYKKILELLILSPDFSFDIWMSKNEFKKYNPAFKVDAITLKENTIKWFNAKLKKYLWFEITLNSNWEISKKMK